MLAELRAAGLRFTSDGDRLIVEPRSALNDELRAIIRAHKGNLLRELAEESCKRQQANLSARDAAPVRGFREALAVGRLHVCYNCAAFSFGAVPAGIGHCRRFDVEAWPFVPFWCSGFALSKRPALSDFLLGQQDMQVVPTETCGRLPTNQQHTGTSG